MFSVASWRALPIVEFYTIPMDLTAAVLIRAQDCRCQGRKNAVSQCKTLGSICEMKTSPLEGQ
jgi:hypothetical protein